MVGVGHILIVALVTRPTLGREILILPVHVTRQTGHIDVRSGKREVSVIVIERRRFPPVRRVALQALVRVLILRVILRALIILLVTRPAIGRRIIELSGRVTLIAGHAHMRTRQREVGEIVIEAGGLPTYRRVTLRAAMIVVARFVIRVRGGAISLFMTRPAFRRRPRILPVGVTLRTTGADVRAGQGEAAQIMVKLRRRPSGRGVARYTLVGEL